MKFVFQRSTIRVAVSYATWRRARGGDMNRSQAYEGTGAPPIRWWPLTFSILGVYVPLALLKRGAASPAEWVLTACAVAAFVALNAAAVVLWQRRRPFLWVPVALALIGFFLAPQNAAAHIFFTFSATIVPWAVGGDALRSAKLVALLVVVEWMRVWMGPADSLWLWWVDVPIFTVVNAFGSAWVVKMTLGIRRMGHVAVRERIARDLSRVLGSTLARIATESELALRLAAEGAAPCRAQQHVAIVEAMSRRVLADVRARIRDYRAEMPELECERTAWPAGDRAADRGALSAHGGASPSNWWPMILAVYVIYLPIGFLRRGGGSGLEWLFIAVGAAAFVALYAYSVVSWQRRRPFQWVVGALLLLGVLFAERIRTASLFITFAAALVPWAVNGNIKRTVWFVVGLIAAELLIGWWTALRMPASASALKAWWWATVPILTAVEAAGYLWAVRMSLRHLELAKAAERERISRDLHDVLGHTLSLITLKSQLAGRLLTDRPDLSRACVEIADIERVSRQALADVQRTILDERVETIGMELERAASTLRTAGIAVQCRCEATQLDTAQESILGLTLREAVTNVVRHAQARSCSIRLHQDQDLCVLEVKDDGRGGCDADGQGLQGMRERIEALGGSVLRDVLNGTHLTVRLPAMPTP